MKLSTKTRYAVSSMIELALYGQDSPVKLAEISKNQGISIYYLEQLFADLRKHGLVEGIRGPGGGYRLAKPPSQISIAKIISAVEKTTKEQNLGKSKDTHPSSILWEDLSFRVNDFLESIILSHYSQRSETDEYRKQKTSTAYKIASMFPPST